MKAAILARFKDRGKSKDLHKEKDNRIRSFLTSCQPSKGEVLNELEFTVECCTIAIRRSG